VKTFTLGATPQPSITVSCNSPTLPNQTTCVASAKVANVQVNSTRITNVAWDWGDGINSTTATNTGTHTHGAALTYDIIAVVTVSGNPSTGTGTGTAVVKP